VGGIDLVRKICLSRNIGLTRVLYGGADGISSHVFERKITDMSGSAIGSDICGGASVPKLEPKLFLASCSKLTSVADLRLWG
jgi:hypothetical protein